MATGVPSAPRRDVAAACADLVHGADVGERVEGLEGQHDRPRDPAILRQPLEDDRLHIAIEQGPGEDQTGHPSAHDHHPHRRAFPARIVATSPLNP